MTVMLYIGRRVPFWSCLTGIMCEFVFYQRQMPREAVLCDEAFITHMNGPIQLSRAISHIFCGFAVSRILIDLFIFLYKVLHSMAMIQCPNSNI